MYDIFYIGNNNTLQERFPFAKKIESTEQIKSNTKMYWLVDSNVKVTDWEVFETKPDRHTEKYLHVWKWNNENYGGVNLIPKGGSDDTVWHNKVVCKKDFDILFEDAPGNYFEQNPYSTHVWCVDKEYVLTDDINWAPGNFEPDFIHSFHLRGQLEHKYPELEGGIKLFPRNWESADTKFHKFLDANVTYPILYVADVNDMQQRDILEDDYVWLIDKEHSINVKTVDWVPNPFEYNYIHVFKMPYQLKEKYPMAMGGIRLVPKEWKNAKEKIHKACPIEDESYDVFYVDNEDFNADTYSEYAERSKTNWFWIVDREHTFNGKLLFVPAPHEQDYIHVFKIPGHLEERYPLENKDAWDNRCGGIRLVHKDFDVTRHKYQEDVCPVRYDIFYADDINDYETPARKSRTKMFWLVDSEHQINEEFRYVPQQFDQQYIQVFKFPGDLEHKYPKAITNISDNRAGGIKLVPVNGNGDAKYIDQNPVGGKIYPIIYTDSTDAKVEEDTWIVPTAFEDIVSSINWQPSVFEKDTCHVFANGLLKWMPAEWNGEIKEHDFSPVVLDIEFEKFNTYEEGLENSSYNWFWVIDPEVDVLDTFDFGFQPNVFDEGKAHVWQKLNPITNKQYDYGGVSLRHKQEKKGRPKYMREPACTQQPYPVYTLTPKDIKRGLDDVYERLANQTKVGMMWIVDGLVKLNEGFDFTYYPTQYDKDVVHIWNHEGTSRTTGVKLVPTNLTFDSHEDILQNSFPKLKEMPQVATYEPSWPVENLTRANVEKVKAVLNRHSDVPYVYTIDPDIEVDNIEQLIPNEEFLDKVHVWQRTNSEGTVIGHGGLRLWPTDFDIDSLTDEQVATCSIPGQLILSATSGTQKEFPVYYMTAEDLDVGFKATFEKLADNTDANMMWIVEPYVDIVEDFEFNYTPTKWEEHVVHIWQHKGSSRNSAVRLVPTNMQFPSDKHIEQNSFDHLKEVNQIATKDKVWPVETFKDVTVAELTSILDKHQDTSFVWTCDPDVDIEPAVFEDSIVPAVDNRNIVHVWQRTNSEGLVIGHGGLRLWPTSFTANSLTEEQLITCSIPDQLILSATGGTQKEYPKYYLDQHTPILDQLATIDSDCDSNMYWLIDPYVTFCDDWQWDFIPTKWEEHVVHVFQDTEEQFRSVRLVPKGTFDKQQYTVKEIINNSFKELKKVYRQISKPTTWPVYTFGVGAVAEEHGEESLKFQICQFGCDAEAKQQQMFFTVDSDVDVDSDFVFAHTPQLDSINKTHVWQRLNPRTGLTHSYGGVRLWPNPPETAMGTLTSDKIELNRMDNGKMQYVKSVGSTYKPYDIVLITYQQSNSEQLLSKLPKGTHLVSDVEGIFNAHQTASNTVNSKMFWVVDGDAEVVEDFNFSHIPDVYDQTVTHVWNSENPVTGDTYGYGGVKLFNTEAVRNATSWGLDFTTGLSSRFKAMPEIACVTRFNTDAYSTWRSAFRECVKLTVSDDVDAPGRLTAWLNASDEHAVSGATQGKQFALQHQGNSEQLNNINDYDWLKQYYEQHNT